jgi:hypothetical protein
MTKINKKAILDGMVILLKQRGVRAEIRDKIRMSFHRKTDKEIWQKIFEVGIQECMLDSLTPEEIMEVEQA